MERKENRLRALICTDTYKHTLRLTQIHTDPIHLTTITGMAIIILSTSFHKFIVEQLLLFAIQWIVLFLYRLQYHRMSGGLGRWKVDGGRWTVDGGRWTILREV